ncbi:MAG: hypothetical protein KBG09_07730, partial [Syntrophobacterales bacterium]|nr:hypothetical protein [Syntrophobacterales bacterium]
WCGGAWPVWAWWWVVPLVGIALCITMCVFFRLRMGNRRFCCFGGAGSAELDETKKAIGGLKADIEKMKGKQGE